MGISLENVVKKSLVIAVAGLINLSVANAKDLPKDVFNSTQISYTQNHKAYPKWANLIKRYNKELETCDNIVNNNYSKNCMGYLDWNSFLEIQKSRDKWKQLVAVNNYGNNRYIIKYVSDKRNGRIYNQWATPKESFESGGDCEDVAFVKYASLKRLGWNPDDLRIVFGEYPGNPHANLIIHYDGKWYLLDSWKNRTIKLTKGVNFTPTHFLNEEGWGSYVNKE